MDPMTTCHYLSVIYYKANLFFRVLSLFVLIIGWYPALLVAIQNLATFWEIWNYLFILYLCGVVSSKVKAWVDKSDLLEARQSQQQSWRHILFWGTNPEISPGERGEGSSCKDNQSVYCWPKARGHNQTLFVGWSSLRLVFTHVLSEVIVHLHVR